MPATPRLRFSLPHPPRRQHGAILVISLMFLVLLTIIAVSSISSVTLEEKMAGNLREQATAFQAAESALRDAEVDLETGIGGTGNRDPMTIAANFATLCSAAFTNGVCTTGAAAGNYKTQIVTAWNDTNWASLTKTVTYGFYTGAPALSGVVQPPRYVIEYLQDISACPATCYFRISARGWGASQSSSVTLQTIYKMSMN
jgi:type IV pilus assembly protein PilX